MAQIPELFKDTYITEYSDFFVAGLGLYFFGVAKSFTSVIQLILLCHYLLSPLPLIIGLDSLLNRMIIFMCFWFTSGVSVFQIVFYYARGFPVDSLEPQRRAA